MERIKIVLEKPLYERQIYRRDVSLHILAKINKTNFTIHRGHEILTQGAAHDILSATPGVHGHLSFNLKIKEVKIEIELSSENICIKLKTNI